MHFEDRNQQRKDQLDRLMSDMAKDEMIAGMLKEENLQNMQVLWYRSGSSYVNKLILEFAEEKITLELDSYTMQVER